MSVHKELFLCISGGPLRIGESFCEVCGGRRVHPGIGGSQVDSFYEHDMARRRMAKVAGECRLKWRGSGRGEPCEECEVVSHDR